MFVKARIIMVVTLDLNKRFIMLTQVLGTYLTVEVIKKILNRLCGEIEITSTFKFLTFKISVKKDCLC
jgi:hypothetical protein